MTFVLGNSQETKQAEDNRTSLIRRLLDRTSAELGGFLSSSGGHRVEPRPWPRHPRRGGRGLRLLPEAAIRRGRPRHHRRGGSFVSGVKLLRILIFFRHLLSPLINMRADLGGTASGDSSARSQRALFDEVRKRERWPFFCPIEYQKVGRTPVDVSCSPITFAFHHPLPPPICLMLCAQPRRRILRERSTSRSGGRSGRR